MILHLHHHDTVYNSILSVLRSIILLVQKTFLCGFTGPKFRRMGYNFVGREFPLRQCLKGAHPVATVRLVWPHVLLLSPAAVANCSEQLGVSGLLD